MVPIRAQGRCSGALWLEDTAARAEWPHHTTGFAQALANLLAMRGGAVSASASETPTGKPSATSAVTIARHAPELSIAFHDRDVDTSLGDRRARAFIARLAAGATAGSRTGAEVIERLAVLALHLADARVLAEPADAGSADTTVSRLLHEVEAAAREERVDYLKFFSDQVIASVDPNVDASAALQRLAEFALRVKSVCENVFARHRATPAFGIGIDVGPAIGTLVGRDPAFAFWGEAVRTASSMADSSLPGTIQVTESVYQLLRQSYVFQLRGHHYLEGVGEFSTYLLGGRL
jgi:class 3 adenylate cyclase